jgi:hypothetical protein
LTFRELLKLRGDGLAVGIAFLAVPLAFVLSGPVACIMFRIPDVDARIRIAGLFLQWAGLLVVAFGLRRTRKDFQETVFFQSVQRWFKDNRRFYRRARSGDLNIGLGSVTATASVGSVASSFEQRLDMLEENVSQLDEKTEKQKRALEAERQNREASDKEIKALLKRALAGGLHWERTGLSWLFLGVGLSTIPQELSRIMCVKGIIQFLSFGCC